MQRRSVGTRGIAKLDVREFERAGRRIGQRPRVRGRRDVGFGMEQFAQPLGGARCAKQVAIDLGKRPERPGDEAACQDEGGDRAPGDCPCGNPGRAVPEQGGDRAEQQADDRCSDDRAQPDAALCGGKIILDRGGEAFGLARFLSKGLDDLHRAQLFGGGRADVGDAVLAGTRHGLQPPPEQDDRQDDQRNADENAAGQRGRQGEEIDDAAKSHHQVAQRDRYRRADDLLDDRGIRGHARGDLRWPVFLEEARSEP